jgi:glucosylceramidase
MIERILHTVALFALLSGSPACKKKGGGSDPVPVTPPPPVVVTPPPTNEVNEVDMWLTTGNQTQLLAKQTATLSFSTAANTNPTIIVDSTVQFQTMDGFGYTLTGGSAEVINALPETEKNNLLNELFSSSGIRVNYLRVSVGASDLSSSVFTYNDIPTGQTDINLTQFSIDKEKQDLLPILKKIVAIQPNIKILASPWTAPLWMKTVYNSVGGKLKPEYYTVYANYLVKYIQAMKAEGITIDAITPQNEPLHEGNNPSMGMTAEQQTVFIRDHLGPAFKNANISTKIIIYDHNADQPNYPITVLNDAVARTFIDGSAFHLYGGDINALSTVKNAHPDKNLYFTEQYTASTGSFAGDLSWHMRNLIVGAPRNWSKNVLEWNLANNPSYGPHTNGGCTTCKGALTIGSTVTRNVAYYIIAHASKFVPAGSKRIQSNNIGNIFDVAYLTPDGKKVLIVLNNGSSSQTFNIEFKNKKVITTLDGGAVATYVW